jgi:methionyl-tRNA formyltransferase
MRVLYLGSPAFAVAPLHILATAGVDLVGVVTQPDRPAGRKRILTPPPVKEAAQSLGLRILQPPTLRDPAAIEQLAALHPDVGVIVAYGEILRPAVLDIPPLGYLNIHPSLLPRHRGPAPVAGAILAGDEETGVTVMKLDTGMDSGPILAQQRVPLDVDSRTGPLTGRLMEQGAHLLAEALPKYAAGQLEPRPQDHSQATVTRLLKKEDGRIDWTLPAAAIERRIRAYDPWPGTFTTWQAQTLKILAAEPHPHEPAHEPPGTLVTRDMQPLVATGEGMLGLLAVQPAGKRAMMGSAWLAGQRSVEGQRFGA